MVVLGFYIQLGIGIGRLGSVEGDGEEVGAHGVVEDATPPLAAVVGRLVDHIPVVALARVVADDVGNVRLNDLLELLVREAAARH